MLVLSRKNQEQIRIGNDITITLIRSGTGSALFGIDAPRELVIVRPEVDRNPPSETAARDAA